VNVIIVLLLFAAAICFLLTAFGLVTSSRVNLVALGLLLWVLVPLILAVKTL